MHPVADDHVAAPIDPGIPQRRYTSEDFEGERLQVCMTFCLEISSKKKNEVK